MPELPKEIWNDRITNELRSLERLGVLDQSSITRADGTVEFRLKIKATGFIKRGTELIPKKTHIVSLTINRAFPYPGGISFIWISDIFHPNINPLEVTGSNEASTGYICLNVLKKWSRLSDLETTVKALQMLVENPNPDDPLNYDVCLEAAEFFANNPMDKLLEQYDFDAIADDEDDDDDIIIIED